MSSQLKKDNEVAEVCIALGFVVCLGLAFALPVLFIALGEKLIDRIGSRK